MSTESCKAFADSAEGLLLMSVAFVSRRAFDVLSFFCSFGKLYATNLLLSICYNKILHSWRTHFLGISTVFLSWRCIFFGSPVITQLDFLWNTRLIFFFFLHPQNINQLALYQCKIKWEKLWMRCPPTSQMHAVQIFSIIILIIHWRTNYPILISSSPSSSQCYSAFVAAWKQRMLTKANFFFFFSQSHHQHSN